MSATASEEEKNPPLSNLPRQRGWIGRSSFFLREAGDLQVSSVLLHLRPWLAGLTGEILEVGCGAQPYRHLVPGLCRYQGLDWEGAKQHFQYDVPDTRYYDGEEFPLATESYDHLFHTEVIEHVWNYELFLKECHRVLVPSGKMFFSVPFQARYHYIPYDYWRFTPAALHKLLAQCGFEQIKISPRGTDITVAAYKFMSVAQRWMRGKVYQKILFAMCVPFVLTALLIGQLSLRLQAGSKDDALGYIVEAVKK